jgi:hypothetical protein
MPKSEGERRRRREWQKRKQTREMNARSCPGKKKYPHRPAAIHAMAVGLFANNAPDLDITDVYQCAACGEWHIGRVKRR